MQSDSHPLKEIILNRICDFYEDREQELGIQPLVYGDLLLIASSLNIPTEQIAKIILSELNELP